MKAIYLDYNATTPVAPEVSELISRVFLENFGNPSSSHAPGREAKRLLEEARGNVASMINAQPDEVFFTSGGSESNNWAIKGVAHALREKGNHIIASAIEHPAVVNPLRFLESAGYEITWLPVDGFGLIVPDDLRKAIRAKTILVTVMHANNEVGTIEPIREIGRIAGEHGVLFHTDAAQSAGKVAIDVKDAGADLLTIAGHKLYAPKGVGALYVKKGVRIEPLIHGASQETGMRAGTENVAYDAGLGLVCSLAKDRLASGSEKKMSSLRDSLHHGLNGIFHEGIVLNGHPEKRLPNTLNVSFKGFNGAEVLGRLPAILASTGAACHSGRTEPSAILLKMGILPEVALGAVRFSAGVFTTEDEIDKTIEIFRESFSR
ncbi:MAG: cysteine desulfurase [Deltaproteobacteria bacterium]|nr:cysteine desulfurase [Deltaproteobacteria bacterium]